ncbi:helix-turn-helix domain-containing protein [Nostoc linckia]|uniref:helix-turn-helix domain-containing protein n=1 Tax=Nostoc linckia TaxID=92942 RepID=UPI000BFFB79C|nr:helix-turn-helix domain-containing protein [Nostoc linckia]
MNKKEAAEFLGISTRTVESYVKAGKISVAYVPIKNGKQAVYNEEELRAFKEDSQTPVHRSFVAPNNSEIAPSEVFSFGDANANGGLATLPPTRVLELLEAIVSTQEVIASSQKLALLWNKLVWNLEEAAAATGYSRYRLRQAIATGNLRAQKVGRGWKVRPQDLREYTKCLFGDKEYV